MADENRFNTSLRRGDGWSLIVTWRPDGEAIDLTGYLADFVILWPRQYSPALGTIAAGSIDAEPDIDPVPGIITVNLLPSETLDIPKISEATYQLRLTRLDGYKITVAAGVLAIAQDYIDA